MLTAPPTTQGPVIAPKSPGMPPILQGALIDAGCVMATCFIVPLVMESNIWPIAGVFWSVLSVPVAAGAGALTGFLVRKRDRASGKLAMIAVGMVLSIVIGVIMFNNR